LTGLCIKDSRRKAFPSFRITLIQRLKASGVAKDARMEMVGHAPRDVHDGTYAGQFEDEFLAAQTLDVTRFDELDHDGLAVDLPARLAHFVTMAVGQQRTSLKTLSG